MESEGLFNTVGPTTAACDFKETTMKKSLIALAVLAASGAAMAQSTVQVYGIVDTSFVKDKNAALSMNSGSLSGSRWGFMGSEDLGGGLKANFKLEQGFNSDVGTVNGNTGFNRYAYVGLAGGFGEVKFGVTGTAYDDISGAANPVFDSVLSPTGVWASTGYTWNPGNTVYYATPSFSGFSGAVSYTLDETVNANNDKTSYALKYENGPLFVGFAYQDEGNAANTAYTRLNGTYDFGAFKLLAGYGNRDVAGVDTKDMSVGVDVPLSSALTLSAGYASSKVTGGTRSSSWAVGATYALSKRTTVYGGYRNDNANAVANNVGVDSRIAVGLRHAF